jgi:hypothetical protein
MITTTESSIVNFWKERGFEASLKYSADNISCWDIDVPEDHTDLKHPEYVGMLIQEKMAFPAIIRQRLQAPVYTIKSGKHYAMVDQSGFENTVPISRSKQLLQFAFTNPGTGACPNIVPLKDTKSVCGVLQRMQKSGAEKVMCLVTSDVAETIAIDAAIRSLDELLH